MNKGTITTPENLAVLLIVLVIVLTFIQVYQAVTAHYPEGQDLTNLEDSCKATYGGHLSFSSEGEYCVYQENYSWRISP
jgi:hypothetical protein